MDRAPTLRDLAKKLGLSVAAVSQGLRGTGNISAKTRELIRKTAAEMNYHPNTYAAALSTRKDPTKMHDVPLAVVRQPLSKNTGQLYPINDITRGIIEKGTDLGYRIEVFDLRSASDKPTLLRILRNRGFRGIFTATTSFCELSPEEASDFCVMSCGRYDLNTPFHSVRQNIFDSTLNLLGRLAGHGCKRILMTLVSHPVPLLDDESRRAAALLACEKYRIRVKVAICDNDLQCVETYKKIQPDGIAAFHVGQYYALRKARIPVGKKIPLALLHKMAERWSEEVGGLVHRDHVMGMIAAGRMDYMIRHHQTGVPENPEQITISPVWYQAGTPLKTLQAIA